jgi:hypothetical protein
MTEILRTKEIPMAFAIITALIIIADFFIDLPIMNNAAAILGDWIVIGASCAMGLGLANVFRVHYKQIASRKEQQWLLSAWLIFVMIATTLIGTFFGRGSEQFAWVYDTWFSPADATAFTLATLYMTSAAFRVMRVRSWEASVLLFFGALSLLKNTPAIQLLWTGFGPIGDWVLKYPSAGVYRSIEIGIGLGIIVLGLRTLLGLEPGVLSRE